MVLMGWFLVTTAIQLNRYEILLIHNSIQLKFPIVHILLILLYFYTCAAIFNGFKLYHSRRLSSLKKELFDLFQAISFCALLLLFVAIFLNYEIIDFQFVGIFWAGLVVIAILFRILLRLFLRHVRIKGRNLRFLLIVGTNNRAIRFARKIESRPELGYRLRGFVDDPWAGIDDFRSEGYRIVCNFLELKGYLRNKVVDDIVISLPIKSHYSIISKIVTICEEQGILVRNLSNLFDLRTAQFRADCIDGEYLITHYTGSMEGSSVLIKRLIDILIACTGLILFAPLFLIISVLVKITSPGSILFIQERVGIRKRIFRLYKFRTMVADAEKKQDNLKELNEASGPVFKIKKDPRITEIGKYLRKFSIDELPQLVNVLKGDMSIVGPRPLPVRDYMGFSQDWHRRRFSVRPGITCLWQVNGRSKLSFEEWMKLDMEYIDRWSLWLDLKILFKTIPAVLKGIGAT